MPALSQASSFLDRAARWAQGLAAAPDRREWIADRLAWRRFYQRMPAEHLRNLAFDARHGVSTADEIALADTGVAADRVDAGNGVYRPLWEPEFDAAVVRLRKLIARCRRRPEEFSFVDLGSGKGKLLMLAAAHPFAEIVGVEYSPGLHGLAEENLRRFLQGREPGCAKLRSVLADAVTQPLPRGPAVCFIFNSFDRPTTRRVMRKLDREAARPEPLLVAYANVRRVSEIGDALGGLDHLRPLVRRRRLIILGNL